MDFARTVVFGLLALGAGGEGVSIQGTLVIEEGKPAILRSQGKEVRLAAGNREITATFNDRRLSGRQMKLVGRLRPDGFFEIEEFYVVRGDALYRLIYFCET